MLALGFVGLGHRSWVVTPSVEWVLYRILGESEWQFSIGQARWIPWKELRLSDLKFQSPGGGRLHLVDVRIRSFPGSLLKGSLLSRWLFSAIRIDPASWGIHQPVLQEILSSGPVTTEGEAFLQVGLKRIDFKHLTLQGPQLRLQVQGWLDSEHQVHHLQVEGGLTRRLLEEIGLRDSGGPKVDSWEPFTMRLQGPWRRTNFSFASNFFSGSWVLETQGKRRS